MDVYPSLWKGRSFMDISFVHGKLHVFRKRSGVRDNRVVSVRPNGSGMYMGVLGCLEVFMDGYPDSGMSTRVYGRWPCLWIPG
jgi:hypothetical protein